MTLEKIVSLFEPQPNGCILFAPHKQPYSRYCRVSLNGKLVDAHRAVWALMHGPIPASMHVCHTCDQTRCVNIHHLFLGTRSDNMRDMVAKGRANRAVGENNGSHKLTSSQVEEILGSSEKGTSIAKRLGVSDTAVSNVRRGRTWKHLIASFSPTTSFSAPLKGAVAP